MPEANNGKRVEATAADADERAQQNVIRHLERYGYRRNGGVVTPARSRQRMAP